MSSSNKPPDKTSRAIGAAGGAFIGTWMGGPIGALIGSVVGHWIAEEAEKGGM